jgi:hypothetical protein
MALILGTTISFINRCLTEDLLAPYSSTRTIIGDTDPVYRAEASMSTSITPINIRPISVNLVA